ncbi:hypothetical protein [Dichelobacter nodosus]|uniref:hypothetical protein n=1 Tax=Dichelobacter nodosus TaxID=870 RepID=UPI0006824855|nr:hypothetical protein [Dichelobacter nodosus]KNZ39956.1 hypothetical protein AKG33_01000 [Dichelobacter nodosus]
MISADHSGIVRGQFTIPSNIPAGTKYVEFIGDRGTRGVTQFTGRGEITIEERRRVRVVERYDPLAQTFTLLTEGRHISAVGLWFEDIGTKPVTVQIRETSTGMPTGVVLAETRINADVLKNNGEETIIEFPIAIYLEALQEFAIVILTDDNVHSLAIAEVGQYDTRAKRYVTEQGYTVGVLLSSSNASTWTPHNNADLAFRLYAAEFSVTESQITLADVTANNASDIYVMAQVERTGIETDVIFQLSDDGDNNYRVQENQSVQLDERTDGKFHTKAVLTGSRKRSPILYPGHFAALGDLQKSATYISRAIPAGSGEAIVTLEVNTPQGSSVKVEIEINGEYQICSPENGEPIGDGWVRNEYKQSVTGGDTVRCQITLSGGINARPRCRQLRMITT